MEGQGASHETFGFPLTPYPLQRELMGKVYETLESGGVGIFESPTGTGKTLALLCPALSWLQRRERDLLADSLLPATEVSESWARDYLRAAAKTDADARWHRRAKRREERRARARKAALLTPEGGQQRRKAQRAGVPEVPTLADFSLELPPALPPVEEATDVENAADEAAFDTKLQIIFCSRTHAQLSQALHEIEKILASPPLQGLAVVTLGARQNLCINDAVRARARGNAAHLNELCRTATEKANAVGGCSLKKQAQAMTDACLTNLLDLEAMAHRGRAPVGGGCPYYGSRRAVREADVLLVPYASLVNSETRTKLGIRAEGNVLIFDEAHNLLEAISDANSVTVTATQACAAVDALNAYAARYEKRLAAGNAVRLRQVQQLCVRLHRHLADLQASSAQTVGAFLVSIGADHFDLAGLSVFLERTELPRKVRGYAESTRVGGDAAAHPGTFSGVYGIAELLVALEGSTATDRVLCQAPTSHRGAGQGEVASVRYLSLDAEARFRELIISARAVIFAGGTLEPRAEFAPLYAGLLSGETEAHVRHFSGRHIVPPAHIFARYVTHGPAGQRLDFRRDQRSAAGQLSELQVMLASVAALTPGGAVFFFPSFDYLAVVAAAVGQRTGGRAVFVERRGSSGDPELSGEGVLRSFAAAVQRDGGAVLLAVSGAKLSEGINFKDELCRLVAVVGLPYPNASDPALLEKMKFLDACRARGEPGLSGREYYAARCTKGVNQCVGRSIRHAKDWAAVLLLDHRYAQANVSNSVSLWLREHAAEATFQDAERAVRAFFSARASAREGVAQCGETKATREKMEEVRASAGWLDKGNAAQLDGGKGLGGGEARPKPWDEGKGSAEQLDERSVPTDLGDPVARASAAAAVVCVDNQYVGPRGGDLQLEAWA